LDLSPVIHTPDVYSYDAFSVLSFLTWRFFYASPSGS
jgi:hypothetical protein